MPTPTYDLIEEKVLGSAQASVTFSSIPGTYKDLVLEIVGSASVSDALNMRYNGDTGANYSITALYGDGTNATSFRTSGATGARIGSLYTTVGIAVVQIQSYANTNVNKTALSRMGDAGNITMAFATLWRSTAAITSVSIYMNAGGNIASGTTARLWGIA